MFQEFPKWISVPGHEDGGVVVFSADEEKTYAVQEQKTEASEEVKRKPGRPKKVSQ